MTRPEDLIYTVDELPPWPRLVALGAQQAVLMSVYLVLIVIVFRRSGASNAATLNALSLGMIALAISTILQALWKGPIGSGYLAPPVFSAIYIGPAVLAAETAGLPAVFAMTMFAGLTEIGLAPLLQAASLVTGPISVVMTYNDFDLAIAIRYQGALLSLPNVGVRRRYFLEEESFSYGLADFLTGVYPDRMEARSEGQNAEIRLIFSG